MGSERKGLVHIYTGNGKGKTTASVGLGMRAAGRGLKVLMVQFLKTMETGEINSINRLGSGFQLRRANYKQGFTWDMDIKQLSKTKDEQVKLWKQSQQEVESGAWDVLILDEIMAALNERFIDSEEAINFIKQKPAHLEIVLTGRNAPAELIQLADYVSEINEVKHPMEKGVPPRKGIES